MSDDLWNIASADTEAEMEENLFTAVRLEAAPYWPVLAGAKDPYDFSNRLSLISDRLDSVTASVLDEESDGWYPVLRSKLSEAFVADFEMLSRARQAALRRRAADDAGYMPDGTDKFKKEFPELVMHDDVDAPSDEHDSPNETSKESMRRAWIQRQVRADLRRHAEGAMPATTTDPDFLDGPEVGASGPANVGDTPGSAAPDNASGDQPTIDESAGPILVRDEDSVNAVTGGMRPFVTWEDRLRRQADFDPITGNPSGLGLPETTAPASAATPPVVIPDADRVNQLLSQCDKLRDSSFDEYEYHSDVRRILERLPLDAFHASLRSTASATTLAHKVHKAVLNLHADLDPGDGPSPSYQEGWDAAVSDMPLDIDRAGDDRAYIQGYDDALKGSELSLAASRRTAGDPGWIADDPDWWENKNKGGYGMPHNHPFWAETPFEDIGQWRAFQKDGTWYAYNRKQNAWLNPQKDKQTLFSSINKFNADPIDIWAAKQAEYSRPWNDPASGGLTDPSFGDLYGDAKTPDYISPEGPVWMYRKGQAVRFYTKDGRQVGPELGNVAPAAAYAEAQGWTTDSALDQWMFPVPDVPPAGFDPDYAGEHWDEDY